MGTLLLVPMLTGLICETPDEFDEPPPERATYPDWRLAFTVPSLEFAPGDETSVDAVYTCSYQAHELDVDPPVHHEYDNGCPQEWRAELEPVPGVTATCEVVDPGLASCTASEAACTCEQTALDRGRDADGGGGTQPVRLRWSLVVSPTTEPGHTTATASVWARFYGPEQVRTVGHPWTVLPPDGTLATQGAVDFAAGLHHVMALVEDGSVWAWGANSQGQLGDGSTQAKFYPQWVEGLAGTPVDLVSVGDHHSMALAGEEIWTWGGNFYGQLGYLSGLTAAEPRVVSQDELHEGVFYVNGGSSFSVALKEVGVQQEVWGWGSNMFGQLGPGPGGRQAQKLLVHAEDVDAGPGYLLAIDEHGAVLGLGINAEGQLCAEPDEIGEEVATPTVLETAPGYEYRAVAAGRSHGLFLADDRTVHACGSNLHGQLGAGPDFPVDGWVQAHDIEDVEGIAAGGWHSLALDGDGRVWAWGENGHGQLGDGTAEDRAVPAEVPGLPEISQIDAGDDFSVARGAVCGELYVWGHNDHGQSGHVDLYEHADLPWPVPVRGIAELDCNVLRVVPLGPTSGTVSVGDANLDCSAGCTGIFEPGETVSLGAEPGEYARFGGWSGACDSGDPEIDLVLEGHAICFATFEPLDEDGDGSGVPDDCDDTDPDVFPGQTEGCNGIDDNCDGLVDCAEPGTTDADGDGVCECDDCDDDDPFTHPGAAEICDGLDNDCDGAPGVDETDGDGDGWVSCLDCDDGDVAVFPGNPEICNAIDDDCDGFVDCADPDLVDDDGDGFCECEDCDDFDATIHPGAEELCDGADNDCDGALGEFEADGDGDGWVACLECDDAEPSVFPGSPEICDGLDNDCDEAVDCDDESAVDGDGDGVCSCDDCDDGDASVFPGAAEVCDGLDNDCDALIDCADPDSADDDWDGVCACDDCDDANAGIFPGNPESCDGADNDCDGLADCEDADAADADGDGFCVCDDCDDGHALSYPGAPELCDQLDNDCDGEVDDGVSEDVDVDGYSLCDGDCDDTDAGTYPGAPEVCDGVDNDCDGAVPADEADGDGDGIPLCSDCDDADADIYPGAPELCDGLDNDCDGVADDGVDVSDDDGDGWRICDGDCADWDDDRYPGAPEQCNFLDDDCDGELPPEEIDDDGDSQVECHGDCDDTNPDVWAWNVEHCDGLDNDCDGQVDEYALDQGVWCDDADGDGYGDPLTWTQTCEQPQGYVTDCSDCDDTDPAVLPGADEYCNYADDDCDGTADEDPVDGQTWYYDSDSDGYGTPNLTNEACHPPYGFVGNGDDCDDLNASHHPGAYETCDGVDEDCDGVVDNDALNAEDWCEDTDGDGYGDESSVVTSCSAPQGYIALCGDCDDGDGAIYPGAGDPCNDYVDNDCDGVPDDGCYTLWNAVEGGDGYTCGIKYDQTLECWGDDSDGLGTPPSGTWERISGGRWHACALDAAGTAWCWGLDFYGQCDVPQGTYHDIEAGMVETYGVQTSGDLLEWGAYGTSVTYATSYRELSADDVDVCAMDYQGHLSCHADPAATFLDFEVGGDGHACAVRTDGSLECWDCDADVGQCDAPTSGTFSQVVAGEFSSCALRDDGAVLCWGCDTPQTDFGQCDVPWNTTFQELGAGRHHVCGIKTDQKMVCWGLDDLGQATPIP